MGSKIAIRGYRLGHQIGQEGLRTHYQALQLRTGKEVFLTVLPCKPGRALKALERRAEQSKKLTHPQLVSALDYGTAFDEYFYYAHEAIPSQTLLEALEGLPNTEETLHRGLGLFIEGLEVVDYIHQARTTHRDLTSSSFRVTSRGSLLVEGFVNARPKTEHRNVAHMVHLPYMAPEQLLGAPADRRTDIYSLGVILFEMITGHLPYESNYAKLEGARQGEVPDPKLHCLHVHEEIEAILLRALGPRESRYSYVGELMRDVESFHNKRSIRLKVKDFSQQLKRLVGLK